MTSLHLVVILSAVLFCSSSVSAQKPLDLAYESATPSWRVKYCNGRPGDSRTYCWRNCTSYAAYKLESTGVKASDFQLLGHARDWAANASVRGIEISTIPKIGAVAFWKTGGGGYGHVGWVEKVNDDGSVATSNYDGFKESFYNEAAVKPDGYIYFSNTIDLVVAPPESPVPNLALLFNPLKSSESSFSKILAFNKYE